MRFRLYPTEPQERQLVEHCAQARFVWNLALEQANLWRRHWGPTPGNVERMRQLTDARAENLWLAEGSVTVQQQALRDFDQAMRGWWAGTRRRPTWRRKETHEGFRQVAVQPAHLRRLNRTWATVHVPKVGPVRFRLSRPVPEGVKSYRVTLDRAGRWHVAFPVKPELVDGPGTGEVVGVDRGVVLPFACSDGTVYPMPAALGTGRAARKVSAAKRGSGGRQRAKLRLAKLKAREAAGRRDAIEKATTDLAARFDIVRIENLKVTNMVRSARGTVETLGRNVAQKRGLNRVILDKGWGLFARRLEDKIGARLQRVPAAYTSQRCSCCKVVDARSRESQAQFVCTACGHSDNADVNAARNIAAGHAVTAREAIPKAGRARPVGALASNLEPQLAASG